MDHVILTRFNLPSPGAESLIRARDGWLDERVKLFERFCLPSVLDQTLLPRWIIYFDPQSPAWLKRWVCQHAASGHFTPIYRAEVQRADLISDISGLFAVKGEELCTTNLDNDDALARDFVERMNEQPRPPGATVYYLTNGLIRSGDALYRQADRHNAFVSLREGWSAPVTCWADWHNRLAHHFPVVRLDGAPGWLQVVHGGNVTNRTRGTLASPKAYRPLFGALLDDVPGPDNAALWRDRLVDRPRRVTRDLSRSVVKVLAWHLLGKAGFERAKHLATRVRR